MMDYIQYDSIILALVLRVIVDENAIIAVHEYNYERRSGP